MKNIIFLISFALFISCNAQENAAQLRIKEQTEIIEKGGKYICDAYLIRADAKSNLKDCKSAIKDYTNAINLSESKISKVHALTNRGNCYIKLGENKKAFKDYDAALDLNIDPAYTYLRRGIAKVETGSKDDGCADIQKALDMGYDEYQYSFDKYCK